MRFCQSFMTELSPAIIRLTDVPAGDIGVGGARSAYSPVQAPQEPLRCGRPDRQGLTWGGSFAYRYGCGLVYFAAEMLAAKGTASTVARRRRRLRQRCDPEPRRPSLWVRPSWCNPTPPGYVVDEAGIDVRLC